jgi:hypothetical protein
MHFSWVVWLGFGISWFILVPVRAWTAARRCHPLTRRHWRCSQLLLLQRLQLLLLLLHLLLLLKLLLLNLILLNIVRLHDRLLLLRLMLVHGRCRLHRCNLLLLLLSLHVLRLCTVRTHINNDTPFESLLSHLTRGLRLLSARRLHLLVLLRCRVLLLEFLRQLLILPHNHSCLRGYLEMLSVQVACGRVRNWNQLLLLMVKVLLRQLCLLRLIGDHRLIAIDLREPLLLDGHGLLAAALTSNFVIKTHVLRRFHFIEVAICCVGTICL